MSWLERLVLGMVVNLLHLWDALQGVFKASIVWFGGRGEHCLLNK